MKNLFIEKGNRIQFCEVVEFEFDLENDVYYKRNGEQTSTSKRNFYKWYKPLNLDIQDRIDDERLKLQTELNRLNELEELLKEC